MNCKNPYCPVGYDPKTNKVLPFQEIVQRKRKYNVAEKAKEMADVTGMKLGDIVNVYETQSYYPRDDYANIKMETLGMGGGGVEAPSIEPGQSEVRVEVTVIWKVK